VTAYRRHPATVSTELGDEVVALQLDTKRYYTLNATAACAWRALAERADERALAAALSNEFDIGQEEAMPHVQRLVRQLLEWRLVEECE
jgi:hypothetical protein